MREFVFNGKHYGMRYHITFDQAEKGRHGLDTVIHYNVHDHETNKRIIQNTPVWGTEDTVEQAAEDDAKTKLERLGF